NAAAVWTSQARAIVHMTGTPSDSSAIANEVDLSGTAATAGYIAGARNFNGTSDEISLNSDVDNVFSGGGTVSAWIRPTGWGENNFGRIASKASSTFAGGALGNGWAFQLDATTGALLFENGFSESTGQWLTAAGTISLNIWQHVAVTYDSNSTSSNPRIFINGAEVAVNEIRTPSGTATSDAALDLKIGNHSAASTRTFDGAIDEFRVWTGARSAAQILADHRSATGALISIGTAESGPGGVLANDTDAESNPLTASLVAGPTNSQSFTLNSNGTFTYTPLANFFGTDTFTYQVSDGTSTTGPFTVSIVVTPVNDLPVIISNGGGATATFDVAENTTAVTTVTSTDVDGGTPVYSIIGGSDQARFSISSTTGALTFVSTRDFETPADLNNDNIYSVVVQVSDGNGAIDTQTINVRIVNVNEAPTSMVIPSVLITEDAGQQTLNTSGTFSDPDAGDILTWSVRQTSGANGFFQNLSIGSASGLLSFQTGLNVNGTAQLEITVVDVGHLSKSRTVLVTATPVDDVPVASPASFTGLAGNLLNVAAPGLAGSVQEVDGDPLTFTITRQPDNGTLVLTAGGGFEYRPATGYTGTDSFEYIASDGITLSNAAVVQIVSQLAPSQS
ncbi:MAG: tandem-95 repeat protein, partial [Planctomyces sp.]